MLATRPAPTVGSAPRPAGTGGGQETSSVAPGLVLALSAAAVALAVHAWVPAASPALVAMAIGLGVALLGTRASLRPGLSVASRRVLRVGVALLGLQVVVIDVLALGWPVLVVVLAVVAGGLGGVLLLGRLLRVDRESALLVAAGFSICGAAAIAAVDGVRSARQESVARAVSLVAVFGSAAMLALPLAGRLLGLSPVESGAWSGAAIQEVGQVVVAGGIVGSAGLQIAVVVKLARVLLLAPVLVLLSTRWAGRHTDGVSGDTLRMTSRGPVVPFFVVAFVGLALLRAVVDVPSGVLVAAEWVQQAALAAGMAALGCALSPAALRSTGARLVALGALATVLVALIALPAAYVI